MDGRIARATSEYLGQCDRAHSDPGTSSESGFQVGTRTRVTRSKLG
jgi:hypothetical protein